MCHAPVAVQVVKSGAEKKEYVIDEIKKVLSAKGYELYEPPNPWITKCKEVQARQENAGKSYREVMKIAKAEYHKN